jgi:hypothetical protein
MQNPIIKLFICYWQQTMPIQSSDTTVNVAYALFRNKSCARDKSHSICMQNHCTMAELEVGPDSLIERRDTLASGRHIGQTQHFLLVPEIYARYSLLSSASLIRLCVHPSVVSVSFSFVFCIYLHQTPLRRALGLLIGRIRKESGSDRQALAKFEAVSRPLASETQETRKNLRTVGVQVKIRTEHSPNN